MMRCLLAFVIVVTCWLPSIGAAESAAENDLTKAVAVMRKIDPAKMTEQQQLAKSQELGQAWKMLLDGAPRVLRPSRRNSERLMLLKRRMISSN